MTIRRKRLLFFSKEIIMKVGIGVKGVVMSTDFMYFVLLSLTFRERENLRPGRESDATRKQIELSTWSLLFVYFSFHCLFPFSSSAWPFNVSSTGKCRFLRAPLALPLSGPPLPFFFTLQMSRRLASPVALYIHLL